MASADRTTAPTPPATVFVSTACSVYVPPSAEAIERLMRAFAALPADASQVLVTFQHLITIKTLLGEASDDLIVTALVHPMVCDLLDRLDTAVVRQAVRQANASLGF